MNHIGEPTRVVVCAANRTRFTGEVVLGVRHYDPFMQKSYEAVPHHGDPVDQGFIDQYGVFMSREEALEVALSSGQINRWRTKTFPESKLFSEDLY
jgi:hypothetical protein